MHLPSRRCCRALACLVVMVAAASLAVAEDVTVETVLTGLDGPCGVAVQPGGSPARYQLYVSDTAAGRVIRMANDALGSSAEVITGFPTAATEGGPFEQVGPRGLLFLDDDQLVVAISGRAGFVLRVYGLPSDAKTLKADQPRQQLELPPEGGAAAGGGYALARTRANEHVSDLLVITMPEAGDRGRLLACRVQADFLGDLQPFGNSPTTHRLRTPVAVAISNTGRVVVGDAGSSDLLTDSRLVFYNPIDATMEWTLDARLDDVVGLAYRPTTGRLYAADLAAAAPQRSGIYRIDDAGQPGRPACRAVKIAEIRRPTALAFGPDGALYVTAFGDAAERGALVKITGDL